MTCVVMQRILIVHAVLRTVAAMVAIILEAQARLMHIIIV